jgi:hypothetical protein
MITLAAPVNYCVTIAANFSVSLGGLRRTRTRSVIFTALASLQHSAKHTPIFEKTCGEPGMVEEAYNLSFLGGRDRRQARGKLAGDPI